MAEEIELEGTPLVLGDGKKWVVPSMPFGSKGRELARLLNATVEVEGDEATEDAMMDLMVATLRLNYPDMTKEKADEMGLFRLTHYGAIIQILTGQESKKDGTP